MCEIYELQGETFDISVPLNKDFKLGLIDSYKSNDWK